MGEKMERLKGARVVVFGIGGVGGYAVEALARSGVGSLDLVDPDNVSITNLNRQIIATLDTVGMPKVDCAARRIASFAPECVVRTYPVFFSPETQSQFDFSLYDYIVDAVDTLTAKIAIVKNAQEKNRPVISSMGMGNKIDASLVKVGDLSKTSVCPLARAMRRELRKEGIEHLKVVFSTEAPVRPLEAQEEEHSVRRSTPGSISYVPAAAGILMASEVIRGLLS